MTDEHIPASEMPESRETFERHAREMEEYRQERERRQEEEGTGIIEAGGKVFARLSPDASDDELLDFLFRVIEASADRRGVEGAPDGGSTAGDHTDGDAPSGIDGVILTGGTDPSPR